MHVTALLHANGHRAHLARIAGRMNVRVREDSQGRLGVNADDARRVAAACSTGGLRVTAAAIEIACIGTLRAALSADERAAA